MKLFRLECPSMEILGLFVDNKVPNELYEAINYHIKSCNFCKEDIRKLKKEHQKINKDFNEGFNSFKNILSQYNNQIPSERSVDNICSFQNESKKYKKPVFGDIFSTKNLVEINGNKYSSINPKYVMIISDEKNLADEIFYDVVIINNIDNKRIYAKFAGADDLILKIKDYPHIFVIHTWNLFTLSARCLKKYMTTLSKTTQRIVLDLINDKPVDKKKIKSGKNEKIKLGDYSDFDDIEYIQFQKEELETIKYLSEASEYLFEKEMSMTETYEYAADDHPDFNQYDDLKKLYLTGQYIYLAKQIQSKYVSSNDQKEKKNLKIIFNDLLNTLKKNDDFKSDYKKIKVIILK